MSRRNRPKRLITGVSRARLHLLSARPALAMLQASLAANQGMQTSKPVSSNFLETARSPPAASQQLQRDTLKDSCSFGFSLSAEMAARRQIQRNSCLSNDQDERIYCRVIALKSDKNM